MARKKKSKAKCIGRRKKEPRQTNKVDEGSLPEHNHSSVRCQDDNPESLSGFFWPLPDADLEPRQHVTWSCDDESCTPEHIDTDGFSANQFFLILPGATREEVYEYGHETHLDTLVQHVHHSNYIRLKTAVEKCDFDKFQCTKSSRCVRFVQLSDSDMPNVEISVTIDTDYKASVRVHNVLLSDDHEVFIGLHSKCCTVSRIQDLLVRLASYSICTGNTDEQFQHLIPNTIGITDSNGSIRAYRESDFGAESGGVRYHSTIRTINCGLLVKGVKCHKCITYRQCLRKMKNRETERGQRDITSTDYVSSRKQHSSMTRNELVEKISQLRHYNDSLLTCLDNMKRDIEKNILQNGVKITEIENEDMKTMMSECRDEVASAFPDPTCFQRLFWEQQVKHANLKNKHSMRWHPMLIRWCLYLRHKSAKAYDAMREVGFINLPSTRTLYDYSHYSKAKVGFDPNVVKLLGDHVKTQNWNNSWQRYVGLLQDEIKIKSDLVYDKHTGEIIGFTDLDSVGNELLNLEHTVNKENAVPARYLLVLMIRGIATDLRFPFAHFATVGITADFLYPILWKAVELLELHLNLNVLFITCDGASANRRFFRMHKVTENDDEVVYYTENNYSKDKRKLYFISDPPHLLKTARNCLSNSYSHKKSRKMWKHGKNISWMHIVDLFEGHCVGNGFYSLCPKLTRAHIDLTSFACMKVSLAAQVLSDTVAKALEETGGAQVSETVTFIRHMNKFFDIMNIKNCYQGEHKRNSSLDAIQSSDDVRLDWLQNDFLTYFKNWKESVENRRGAYSKSDRAKMMLSYQTLQGLEITVRSVVDCTKFLLNHGVRFVLTTRFNQDPLEQHFGVLRHKGGAQDNPTVCEATHSLAQLRVVNMHGLGPKNGNVKRGPLNEVIDNSPLPKRKKQRNH